MLKKTLHLKFWIKSFLMALPLTMLAFPLYPTSAEEVPTSNVETQNETVLSPLAKNRQAFLEASKWRYQRKQGPALIDQAQNLSGYVLKDYLLYWGLLNNLIVNPDGTEENLQLQAFIKAHQHQYLGERAASDYIMTAKDRLNPTLFNELYEHLQWNKTEPPILAWYYFYNLESNPSLMPKARAFLMTSSVQGTPLVALAQKMLSLDPKFTPTLVSVLAQKQRWNSLKKLLPDLSLSEAQRKELFFVITQPQNRFKQLTKKKKKIDRQAAEVLILRLSSLDPDKAQTALKNHQSLFSKNEQRLLWANIGYQASTKLMDEAAQWYKKAGNLQTITGLADPNDMSTWAARAFLRQGFWTSLKRTLEEMPASLRREETWTYWYGRALLAHDQKTQAKKQFLRISTAPTFYGLLARGELNLPEYVAQDNTPVVPHELQEAYEKSLDFQKAREFYALDMYNEGHREWNWGLRHFERADWPKIAVLAGREGLYHRMINTTARANADELHWNEQFPMPYSEAFKPIAQQFQVQAPWIYGIIRQESRFMEKVRSGVGAIGLMQIMPKTGRWLAKKNNLEGFSVNDLTTPSVNVTLGALYLSLLSESFNGERALATAAYNAGPARVQQWRKKVTRPMEGAIFIETIPFFETREYVKNVLLNTQFYEWRLNLNKEPFKETIGEVLPGDGAPIALP